MSPIELDLTVQAAFDQLDRAEEERQRYSSPFEKIKSFYSYNSFGKMSFLLKFSGDTQQLTNELATALEDPEEVTNFTRMALHPPRLVRAMIDYKIANPVDQHGEHYVDAALDLALAMYRDPQEAANQLELFRDKLSGVKGILDVPVQQPDDAATWDATDPDKSFQTAQKLKFQVEHLEILLIALGHGGVAAGMDVFLYYSAITGSTDSRFYAVRFSRAKHGDVKPQISDRETDLLREMATGRQIVVFDEDTVSGDTLEIAADTFRDILDPSLYPIMTVSNVVLRGKTEKIQVEPISKQNYKNNFIPIKFNIPLQSHNELYNFPND
jgi:hypothetical protein